MFFWKNIAHAMLRSLRPYGCAFGHPLVAQCPYEGATLFQNEDSQPKEHCMGLDYLVYESEDF